MHIDKADIDHVAAANGDPGFPDPFELNVPVDQNVKVRISVLLEFQDPNVLRGDAIVALQVDAKLRKRPIYVWNWITVDL
jgi:hypothetical protein